MPRKNAFSGKQKKQQLKEKKVRKQDGPKYLADWSDEEDEKSKCEQTAETTSMEEPQAALPKDRNNIVKINAQPNSRGKASSGNSLLLHFLKEPNTVIEERKKKARRPYTFQGTNGSECNLEQAYPPHINLDFPKRPPWDYNMSKQQLERQEKTYFQSYLNEIMCQTDYENLSYFDFNLENWRQLWRVFEINEVFLIVADIRYPVLHVPPHLVNHIQQVLRRPLIVVLNKVDLVSPALAVAWKRYLQSQFPGIRVVFFSSFLNPAPSSSSPEDAGVSLDFEPSTVKVQKPKRKSAHCLGPADLYKEVVDIVSQHGENVDLSNWREQLEEEGLLTLSASSSSSSSSTTQASSTHQVQESSMEQEEETNNPYCAIEGEGTMVPEEGLNAGKNVKVNEQTQEKDKRLFKDGIVTIGCIGYPNAGKSSVLNALRGKNVVSVSKTPGHTKHLQTIFLSPTLRLCDCPGLVFPSAVPKALQVIAGIFPVAQVREPYSSVQHLAERVDLPSLLKLQHPAQSSPGEECDWSANEICEAFALKRGFLTSKAARPDIYRAANKILRLAVEGQLCLTLRPPAYAGSVDEFKHDPETKSLHSTLLKVACLASKGGCYGDDNDDDAEDCEDDDEEEDENHFPVSKDQLLQ